MVAIGVLLLNLWMYIVGLRPSSAKAINPLL